MVAFFRPRVREIHVECIDGVVLDAVAQEVENISPEHSGVGECARLVHLALGELGPSVVPFATHDHEVRVLGGVFGKETALAASDFDFHAGVGLACDLREHVLPLKVKFVREAVGCCNRLSVAVRAEYVMPKSLRFRIFLQVAEKLGNDDFLFNVFNVFDIAHILFLKKIVHLWIPSFCFATFQDDLNRCVILDQREGIQIGLF